MGTISSLFNGIIYVLLWAFCALILIVKVKNDFFKPKPKLRRPWTKDQIDVLKYMAANQIAVVIRVDKTKFQIVFVDGSAAAVKEPEFITFFNFMEINEKFGIYTEMKALKERKML